MEFLIYAANSLYVASHFTSNILRLMILSLVAGSILVAYFPLRVEPLMTVVYWNLFFIALNLFQVGRTVWSRQR